MSLAEASHGIRLNPVTTGIITSQSGLVEEIARHQNADHKDEQQAQIERSPVQLYRLLIRIRNAIHSETLLSLDELHRRDRAQEKHRRHG